MRSRNPPETPVRLRRLAGSAWLAGWLLTLYLVASPWRDLGGVVDERLRWLESAALVLAIPVGATVGRFARDAALRDGRVTHARVARHALLPPAIACAAALLGMTVAGIRDPIGVVTTAFLSYWAGVDLAFGALPLMEGRSYRFERPLEPEDGPPRDPREPSWTRPRGRP